MFEKFKRALAVLLIAISMSASMPSYAQEEGIDDFVGGEVDTIGSIFNAITTFDYGGAISSAWNGIGEAFSDGVDFFILGGWLTPAGEFAEAIGNEIAEGANCVWNVTKGTLPNIDPEHNRVRDGMIQQQFEVSQEYAAVSLRVHQASPQDPRKQRARELLDIAAARVGAFMCINVQGDVEGEFPNYFESERFRTLKQNALSAIADARGALLSAIPIQGVPEGDIVEDFIPQFVRLLFGFASLAVFVAFVVAGLFYITAFGNEERLTKAKDILMWTLVGFAIVVLAFAIVRAVTDIDFFGFI